MKLSSESLKQAVREIHPAALAGVANIERFQNAPAGMHPLNIFPDCKSVVSIVMPIPRGSYRGINEGTHWPNYTFYSYNRLNTLFRPAVTYALGCLIEDHGWEAVPVYPGVPERGGRRPPVAAGRPAADINLNVRIAALACGLGEIGWAKVFITGKYGPRVRIGTILIDAELEPDPLIIPGTLCNRCMACVRACPGGAIPGPGEREPIRIRIDDQEYEWGDVHMGRCTLTHHGMNWEASPFLKKDFPGLDLRVRENHMSEEAAYRLTYPMAGAKWPASPEFPVSSCIDYYRQIKEHTDYFAVCGARGCIVGCMSSLEKRGCIEQSDFPTPALVRPQWRLNRPEQDRTGGIAEGRFPEQYNRPADQPGSWQ